MVLIWHGDRWALSGDHGLGMLSINPLYVLSGLLVGFVVGLTGVGGGSLMTPLLVMFFGIHPAAAVGTDLFFAAATKSAGTLVHGLAHSVDWRIVMRLAIGSLPGATLALLFIAGAGISTEQTGLLISLVLGIMLLVTSVSLLFRNQLLALAANGPSLPAKGRFLLTVLSGAVLGVLVSISSVGAGAIGVTVLMVLYPELRMRRLVGTDIAHAVPLTIVAGIGHWAIGSVDGWMLLSLLIGSVPGILAASAVAPRIRELPLRLLLAFVLVLTGLRMLFG